MIRNCIECGKEFKTSPGYVAKGWGKLCSPKCKGKWASKYRVGEMAPKWEGGRINKICEICGKSFSVKKSGHLIGYGRFCTRKCKGEWMTKTKRGINSPSYKTGYKIFNTYIRQLKLYFKWRQNVFKRDNFTCAKCGQKGGYLHAHHIISFKHLVNEFKKTSTNIYDDALNYMPFWDINNGVTMCRKCHRLHHFGK